MSETIQQTTVVDRGAVVDRRPRVLCVDDEPNVLDSLRRQLHREFAVVGVESGLEALALLAEDPSFAVLMSDMRMPGLDGAAVLRRARTIRPDTVRILLTGQADMEDAVAAVNDGNIFRFLIKPCPRPVLVTALTDAVGQNRMITAEKELLERTLRGSVAALFETLSLANPMAFARAARIKRIVSEMVEATKPEEAWFIEIAAMLSQIGTVVLAPGTLSRLNTGARLSAEEQLQVRVLPWHAEKLLAQIPRLEVARQIIVDQTIPFEKSTSGTPDPGTPDPGRPDLERPDPGTPDLGTRAAPGAQMLRVAVDLESLEAAGTHRRAALSILEGRAGSYDPALLSTLLAAAGPEDETSVLPLTADELQPGMTIVHDVIDPDGGLLVGRGYRVTESLIERIRNWKATTDSEPIYVTSD